MYSIGAQPIYRLLSFASDCTKSLIRGTSSDWLKKDTISGSFYIHQRFHHIDHANLSFSFAITTQPRLHVACERRRISSGRFLFGGRETTAGNTSALAGLPACCCGQKRLKFACRFHCNSSYCQPLCNTGRTYEGPMKLESFKDVKTNQKNDPRFLNQSFFSSFDGRRHRCTIEIYPSVDIGPAYVVRQQQRTAPQQHLNKQKTIRGVM